MLSLQTRKQASRMLLVATARRMAMLRPLSTVAAKASSTMASSPVVTASDRSVETMEALKKLLLNAAQSTYLNKMGNKAPFVTEESLQRALSYFSAQLENARLCIQDTKEASDADYEVEYQTASQALQAAIQSYVDFLELLGSVADVPTKEAWENKRTTIFEQLQVQLKEMKNCVRKET